MKAQKYLFKYGEKFRDKYDFTPNTKIIFNSNIIELWIPETRKIGELLNYREREDQKGIIATIRIDKELDLPIDEYFISADYEPEKINDNNELESIRLYRINLVEH